MPRHEPVLALIGMQFEIKSYSAQAIYGRIKGKRMRDSFRPEPCHHGCFSIKPWETLGDGITGEASDPTFRIVEQPNRGEAGP